MTRLIDADALESEMYFKSDLDDGRSHWDDSGLWIQYQMFEEAIKNAPTVDAVPVRHGKWKVTPVYIKCSECGESFMLIPQNYCPNCGSRMDAE